jgi:hypothetical protein
MTENGNCQLSVSEIRLFRMENYLFIKVCMVNG